MVEAVRPLAPEARTAAAYARAAAICDEDVELNRTIGEHGLGILRAMAAGRPGRPLNVLTHCNAGWLATRSEEHTSELQSLMRISYAVFCLKKKKSENNTTPN